MNAQSKTILIVGSGRLSNHLNHWVGLQKNNYKILNWDRSQDPHAIKKYVSVADFVWLAISDSAIVSFYEKYINGFDCKAVHFSGALHDARILSAHPLMTFTDEIYSDEIYEKITFAITGFENLSEALPGFQNKFFKISADHKPMYHALCVIAGNFPQMLWSEVSAQCLQKNIPFEAFTLYLRQSLENFISSGAAAVTGPIARKDLITIEKNKAALPEKLKNIYSVFESEFLK